LVDFGVDPEHQLVTVITAPWYTPAVSEYIHGPCLTAATLEGQGNLSVIKLKDAEHLLRLAAVFIAGLAVFLVLRAVLVPHSFGQYGHYRGDALAEVAAHPVRFAGQKVCEDCHGDIVATKSSGKHAGVHCEACHGPQAAHAENPVDIKPQLPDTAVLCARCHEANVAKPAGFPQVDTRDHSGGQTCKTCHQPHSPLLMPGEKPQEQTPKKPEKKA